MAVRNGKRNRFESEEHVVYHVDTSWQSETEHFFDCVEADTSVKYGNSQDALNVMRMIDRIYAEGSPNEQ